MAQPRARALSFLCATALLAAASCGASEQPDKPLDFQVDLKDTTSERCLVAANVKRERKESEPAKITVRHLLVKYAGAKKADASVKRTRGQACLRAQEAYKKLTEGAEFEAIVKEYSEEPGAASRGGTLGAVERRDVVPPFANAAFELEPNQVSEVVETDFGFHVIMRTE